MATQRIEGIGNTLEDKLVAGFSVGGAATGFLLGAYQWAEQFANADSVMRESMGGNMEGYGMMASAVFGAAFVGMIGAYVGNGASYVANRIRGSQ